MDLFAPEPKVLSVSELTRSVRSLLESEIGQVWVEGEIANHRKQSSGHQYFTLKDDKSQVPCVMFYRPGRQLRQIPLSDGMQVQVRGDMTVYEARGQYQIIVSLVQAAGVGLLQAKFEALKRKLEGEGLFDQGRKRPLPKFPGTIGIVTSPTGAAIRDMLNILQRRAPWAGVLVNPVRVQGDGAAEEIAAAVAEFNDFERLGLPPVDVIVVCRGGGSAEDLWEFNEEILARAIYESAIPVVSAVGHEIDFSISDFVADLRAPTPSAAAELIVPDTAELRRRLVQIRSHLERHLAGILAHWKSRLTFISRSVLFREPARRVGELSQSLDQTHEALGRELSARLSWRKQRIEALLGVIRQHRPDQVIRLKQRELAGVSMKLNETAQSGLAACRHRLQQIENVLRVLGPQATLERGYSITTAEGGGVMNSVNQVASGMRIVTTLADGKIKSEVE
jgi:exodeoxyribonuclease VII large subunit